jgi:hypothetical protein
LARRDEGDQRRERLEEMLKEVLAQQAELVAQRPSTPTHAAVCDTDLGDVLVLHPDEYKITIDTVRIACCNVEAELAARLGPLLPRAAEAKMALSNLFAAPGRVQVGPEAVTVKLLPAGNPAERAALAQMLADLDALRLTLPGDPVRRPLRFRSQI